MTRPWTDDEIAQLTATRKIPGRSQAVASAKAIALGLPRLCQRGQRRCRKCKTLKPSGQYTRRKSRCDSCVTLIDRRSNTLKCRKCTTVAPRSNFTKYLSGAGPRLKCDACCDAAERAAAVAKTPRIAEPKLRANAWTENEIARLRSGRRDIAGRSPRTIRAKVAELGLAREAWGPLPEDFKMAVLQAVKRGETFQRVARHFRTTRNAVAGIVQRNRGKLHAMHV